MQTPASTNAKQGRNEPCRCGSGKKYKHCHLPIEWQAEKEAERLRAAKAEAEYQEWKRNPKKRVEMASLLALTLSGLR